MKFPILLPKIMFILRLLIIIAFAVSVVYARAPLESYKHYMFVMVHGIGANTMEPHDYDVPGPETGVTRKSAIFDKSADDARPGLDLLKDIFGGSDKNWQGDLGGTLQSRVWGIGYRV